MFKSKFIALAFAIGAVGSIPLVHAGTVAGFGGGTEVTQLMNNAELIKIGVDGAQTAVTSVNQYMTQIEQYRNQLINTAGMDPMKLNAQVNSLNTSYQQLANYREQIFRTSGSMNNQLDAWGQRYTTAKVAGRTLKEQLEAEAKLREGRNGAALERAKRDEQIMQDVNRDIEQLRQAEADIPKSQGMNESIQNMHRTMNKIAYQNTKMIELLVESSAANRNNNMDRNVDAENSNRIEKYRRDYQDALRKRQLEFIAPKSN
jgi:conjugal transfer/entry exclusion protein